MELCSPVPSWSPMSVPMSMSKMHACLCLVSCHIRKGIARGDVMTPNVFPVGEQKRRTSKRLFESSRCVRTVVRRRVTYDQCLNRWILVPRSYVAVRQPVAAQSFKEHRLYHADMPSSVSPLSFSLLPDLARLESLRPSPVDSGYYLVLSVETVTAFGLDISDSLSPCG